MQYSTASILVGVNLGGPTDTIPVVKAKRSFEGQDNVKELNVIFSNSTSRRHKRGYTVLRFETLRYNILQNKIKFEISTSIGKS